MNPIDFWIIWYIGIGICGGFLFGYVFGCYETHKIWKKRMNEHYKSEHVGDIT